MDLSTLSAWVSLVAALLSICYVAADYWRSPPASAGGSAANGSTRDRSLGGFVAEHGTVIVAVTSLAFVAGGLHWLLATAFGVSPVPVWIGFLLLSVIVVIGDLSDDLPDPET